MSEASTVVSSVDELKALVGQELGLGEWFAITQDLVNAFADVTGDDYFIHVDPERAAATPVGGTVAHGFLTLSLLPRLGRERVGLSIDLQPRLMLNYGLNRVRFITPVRVGARIRLRTRLAAVQDVGPGVYNLVYDQTVEIEGEPRPAMVAETIGRVYV